MKSLYIGSTARYSGKSLITIGIGLKLKRDGYRVGYFKPLGKIPVTTDNSVVDYDAEYMKQVLGLDDPLEVMSPVVLTRDLVARGLRGEVEGMRNKVKDAYEQVCRDKDVVLIGGSRGLAEGAFLGISGLSLIKALNTSALIIDPYQEEVCVDCLIAAQGVLGDRLVGVVLNRVAPKGMEYVREMITPFLEHKGFDVMGIFPQDRVLDSISVRQLNEVLNGRVLCCEDKLDELVERFSIGAMDVDSALTYFQKTPNKAVITGGARSDIQLAALETSTKCLILTGDQMPNDVIIGRARMAGVPILIVKSDTLTTVERFESVLGRTRIRGEKKLQRAIDLMDQHFDYQKLYKKLGLGE